MDSNREQSTPVVVENKGSLISRKVWDMESTTPKIMNVNGNGTIPMIIQMKMDKNKLMPTDYVDNVTGSPTIGKRLHIQKINNTVESKYI